jgi:acid phosphatase
VENSTDFLSGRLAVVVTFDGSSSGHQSSPILAVVCDVNLSGKVVSTSLNHYGLSRWLSETVAAPPLKNAATATDMRNAFGL